MWIKTMKTSRSCSSLWVEGAKNWDHPTKYSKGLLPKFQRKKKAMFKEL